MSRIIGIDLGTSTSEVGILKDGKPIVIKNAMGSLITPSVVGISEDGNVFVGENAKEQLLVRPESTVMEVKRLMGSGQRVKMGQNEYSPQEISSFILKFLRECAEDFTGEGIERAVITVPAYFTDEQRRATVEAGKLAGLKVERIINEPTAAALTYGIEHMEENSHVLVYDLGGGTLDVTLLEMFEGVLEVKASSGNNRLGGKDFDEKIMELLIDEFESTNELEVRKDLRAMARIKQEAEECKIALSILDEYRVNLPFIGEKNEEPLGMLRNITRQEFEGLIGELIYSSKAQIDVVLKDGKITPDEIDIILLVGGSTRVPLVGRFLEETLNKKPNTLVDPDLAVVMGAAIQAGIINNELSAETDILITDVCPYTLGLETMDFMYGMPVTDVYDVIIPRNLTIPVVREKTYSTVVDNQESVEIKVYQGDHKKASLNNFLGKFNLSGIPANEAFKEKIKIKFMYDINGILQVEAVIESTGEQAFMTIETTGVELEEEEDLSLWKDASMGKKYRRLIKDCENALEENLDSEIYTKMDEALRSLKKALINEENDKLEDLDGILTDLLYDMEDED